MKNKKVVLKAVILSFIVYCSFSLKLDPVSDSAGADFLFHYLSRFSGFTVQGSFFFLGLVLYFYKLIPEVSFKKLSSLKSEIFLSFLLSSFMLIGISKQKTYSSALITGFRNGQIFIALTVFIGYFLTASYKGKNASFIDKHPFLFVFIALFIAYLPRAIISLPGIGMGDTPWQIVQAFPGLSYSYLADIIPKTNPGQFLPLQEKLLSPTVMVNLHHPAAHTMLLHGCIVLGHSLFGSWNVGLYVYTIMQELIFLSAIAYSVAKLVDKKIISAKYVWLLIIYFFIHPHIHSYVFLITKDIIYAAFFIVFMTNYFFLLREDYGKREITILSLTSIGMILFRNETRFLLPAFYVISFMIIKKIRKPLGVLLGIAIVSSILIFQVIFPSLKYTPGSIREMLSVPFQQTARYVSSNPDDVSEQEKEAIDKVLDYDSLADYYDPDKSDNVKNTYRQEATSKDLAEYFKSWFNMFIRHPGVYISATINNYYQYIYPANVGMTYYGYEWSSEVLENTSFILKPIGVEFSYPERFEDLRKISDYFTIEIARFPFISLLMTTAVYVWIIILVIMYGIKHQTGRMLCYLALPLFTILVCFLGPTNGRYGARYLFSIITAIPLILPMSIALIRQKGDHNRHKIEH